MQRKSSSQRGAGRPKIDDREPVLGFMTARLANEPNVCRAANPGLKICGFVDDEEGWVLAVERKVPRATLQRRYRDWLAIDKAEFERMTAAFRAEGARAIGISVPKFHPFFVTEEPRKRGRPKKIRGANT